MITSITIRRALLVRAMCAACAMRSSSIGSPVVTSRYESVVQLVGQFPAEGEQVRFDAAGVRERDGVVCPCRCRRH
jgi:hypothetical protein